VCGEGQSEDWFEKETWVGSEWSWRLSWRKNRFEWESKQEDELLMTL